MAKALPQFEGMIAVVSGAASGIGNQIARDLAHRGARVYGIDIQDDYLFEVPGAERRTCDLAHPDSYRDLVLEIEDECGRIDLLANIAGIDEPVSALSAGTELYRKILDVNFFSPLAGTLAALPGMVRRSHGFVLNCSSDSVHSPIAHESAYVASKGALSAFTESVDLEVRPSGVFAHLLYPGFVETPLAIRSIERGMRRPPRSIVRTTEQVSAAALDGLGQRGTEIYAARAAAWTPLFRMMAPRTFRRALSSRTMPLEFE